MALLDPLAIAAPRRAEGAAPQNAGILAPARWADAAVERGRDTGP